MSVKDWLLQNPYEGKSQQQLWNLFTGRDGINGSCQSEQHTPSKRPSPTVHTDNTKKQRRDNVSASSAASGMLSQTPAVLCYAQILHMQPVS